MGTPCRFISAFLQKRQKNSIYIYFLYLLFRNTGIENLETLVSRIFITLFILYFETSNLFKNLIKKKILNRDFFGFINFKNYNTFSFFEITYNF
jgi:hypothetical protein